MAKRGFRLNPRFEEELARDPQVRRVLDAAAKEALPAARAVARSYRDTGAYEASLKVDGNRLLTTDPAGHIIEFGSVDTAPQAPLRKAAEQVGARVVDRG